MDLATLFVRFKADTSDVDGKVKQLEADTTKSGKNITKVFAQAFSAAAIGVGIKKTIDAASDLNETVSKTEVIFGNASTAVEKAGDSAAKSMGLSKRAYLDAASSLKGLLDNMGLAQDQSTQWSQKLVQLGSDLGSFFNRDPAEAVEAIGSALRGETEPIRAFNVQISQAAVVQEALKEGLISSAGELDNNSKAQATLALIMQQTTAAQGDFARTADGAANSQRTARAEMENSAASIGQALLPVYTKVVQTVGDMARIFATLPGPVQTAVIAMVGFVALSGPLSTFIEVIGKVKSAITSMSVGAPEIAALAGVILVLAAAFGTHDDKQKEVAARSREVAANLDTETDAIVKQHGATGGATTATQAYADAQTALSHALTGSDAKGQALAKALGALGFQANDSAKLIGLLQVESGTLVQGMEKTGNASHDAALAQKELFVQLLGTKGISADVAQVLFEAGSSATYAGNAADVTKDKTKGWTEANKALFASIVEVGRQAGNTDINQISKDYLDAAVASSSLRAALVAQAEAMAGSSRNGADAATVYQDYLQLLEQLTPAQRAQLDATTAQTAATHEHTQAIAANAIATESAADAQARLKAQQEDNTSATKHLRDSVDSIGETMYGARDAADDLKSALDRLLGIGIDLEEANRGLEEGIDKVTSSIKDNGATLDINTEAGRNNRSAIEDQVKAIQNKITADVASGVAVGDATNAANLYREQLINVAVQSGLSRQAAEAYIDQLGLTPTNITTAVQLAHDQEMKVKLQGLLDQMGDIDAGAAAEIQALIDQGSFNQAASDLAILTRNRRVTITTFVNDRGSTGATPTATGGFFPGGTNQVRTVAERPGRGGDEVVLPLGDPGRIRQLLGANGVGSRIFDAVGAAGPGDVAPSATSTSTTSSVGGSVTGVHVDHLEIHDDDGHRSLAQMAGFILAGI
jgi:hypothetical protein